jgi:hypothetical protein
MSIDIRFWNSISYFRQYPDNRYSDNEYPCQRYTSYGYSGYGYPCYKYLKILDIFIKVIFDLTMYFKFELNYIDVSLNAIIFFRRISIT